MGCKNKGNTKAQQSQKWMEESLFQLMRAKPYEEISIQNITDTAQLSRRTFYRNYEKKDEILLDYFRRICKEYEKNLRSARDLSFPNIANIFFSTMQGHLDFLFLVNQHHIMELFIKEMDAFLLPLHLELRGPSVGYDIELARIALTFSIGGFGRILTLWLNEGAEKTPDELAKLMEKAIRLLI
ncbi:TetR/AcrR family transcriptional regulator [Ruminiclostridium cellobioparum]|uniref:AcrR family transcriptional regulator n=2 Tax=Ruminiclostridium cellobioparum TaxID=29355 RepID=S0FHK2_RUMCE|nr:TetR/AcrR family transcriptional regulator [Ruminiclostridium cellobioparum]EMS70937.1 AcrR family transcriptional regulator [Ruminiclostridium cellobioparum subsp. termitidis CT1112]